MYGCSHSFINPTGAVSTDCCTGVVIHPLIQHSPVESVSCTDVVIHPLIQHIFAEEQVIELYGRYPPIDPTGSTAFRRSIVVRTSLSPPSIQHEYRTVSCDECCTGIVIHSLIQQYRVGLVRGNNCTDVVVYPSIQPQWASSHKSFSCMEPIDPTTARCSTHTILLYGCCRSPIDPTTFWMTCLRCGVVWM